MYYLAETTIIETSADGVPVRAWSFSEPREIVESLVAWLLDECSPSEWDGEHFETLLRAEGAGAEEIEADRAILARSVNAPGTLCLGEDAEECIDTLLEHDPWLEDCL